MSVPEDYTITVPWQHHFNELAYLIKDAYALISENPHADTAVIFVHVFLGDATETWLNFQGMIDTHSHKYPEWGRCDAFFFSYRSFRDSVSDSAESLLRFDEELFPKPPRSIFTVSAMVRHLVPSLIEFSLKYREYKHLVFVGHSEGALVIRRAICLAYKRTEGKHGVLTARLALFAPAHLGFRPTGWIGACLAVGRIAELVRPVLSTSPAFIEMSDRVLLDQVKHDTEEFLRRSPHLTALRARILFGVNDHVVSRIEYTDDIPETPEPNQDHTSICKPRGSYERPLDFALKVIT